MPGYVNGVLVDEPPEGWEAFEAAAPEPLPQPRREVSKLLAMQRLEAAGLGDAFETALAGNGPARRAWHACVSLYADDEQVRSFLTALGADPEAILAEGNG